MGYALKKAETYTYGDYLKWHEDERWELICGDAYNMSAAPSTRHQQVCWELAKQVAVFLSDKPCRGFFAPFDVRLPNKDEADEAIETVVQPDISVICDLKKIDDRGCRGAPDFIAEITSPFTASKDHIRKVELYEKHGVKGYWIIHPFDNIVYVRLLNENGRYGILSVHDDSEGYLEVAALPGLKIDLKSLFK